MQQTKTQIRTKFYLHKILQFKKSIEAQGFLILPSYDCFTISQEKQVEKELIGRGIIRELKHGGDWNDEGFFNKNLYSVDWNQLDVEYKGYLKDVPYVDLVKEFNNRPIKRSSQKIILKDEDLVISPHINKRIHEGLTPQDLIDCLESKYPLKREIDEMLREVNPHLVVENKGEFKLTIEGDILRKVSYRVTNSLVALRKSDGSRDRFLESEGLKRQLHGDIKSEIPRVTRLIHTGEWLPFTFDFYSQYFGKKEIPPMMRTFVKDQAMPLYFTNWKSPAAFSSRQYQGLEDKYKGELELETRRILEKMKEGFDREVGESLNSLIFLYTSWIETRALQILVREHPNARFFQIYDEIFSTENCGDLEPVYRKAAEDLYARIQSLNFKAEEEEAFKVSGSSCVDVDSDVVDSVDIDVDSCYNSIKRLSLVKKMANLNASSGLKFSPYSGNKNTLGHHWNLTEETKAKLRQPKSEETKAKMRQPKSEEMKEKLSNTLSETLNKQIEFVRNIMTSSTYINIRKVRERQQYIDKKLVEKFGEISSTTLTKIRKLATSASKEK